MRESNASQTVMSTRFTRAPCENADSDSAGLSFCASNKLPGDVDCWSWTRCQTAANMWLHKLALTLCPLEVHLLLKKKKGWDNMVWISLPKEGSWYWQETSITQLTKNLPDQPPSPAVGPLRGCQMAGKSPGYWVVALNGGVSLMTDQTAQRGKCVTWSYRIKERKQ